MLQCCIASCRPVGSNMGQSVMYGYVMFAGSSTVLSTWWICVVGQIGFGTSEVVFIKLSFVLYIYIT